MYTVLQAGRAFCYTIGKNLDMLGSEHVRQVRKDCASVILWCAEKATWMAGEGIQLFGGNGYINEYPLGRLCATPSSTRSAPAPRRSAAC